MCLLNVKLLFVSKDAYYAFAILQENLLFFGFFVTNATNLNDKAFFYLKN